MTFTLYPSIPLRHGRAVQSVGGDPQQVARERADAGEQAALLAEAGAAWLHVVDVDAALGGRNQWLHLGRLQRSGLRIQFGGGIRSMTQVQQLLDLGVERVVVGTQGVRNPAWARELARVFPGRIVLALDARGRDVAVNGWRESSGVDPVSLAAALDDAGFAAFLHTSIDREGRGGGVDHALLAALRHAAPRTPLLAAGGVAGLGDLRWLKGAGAAGAVLGLDAQEGIGLAQAFAEFPSPAAPVVRVLRAREELAAEGDAGEDGDVEDEA